MYKIVMIPRPRSRHLIGRTRVVIPLRQYPNLVDWGIMLTLLLM